MCFPLNSLKVPVALPLLLSNLDTLPQALHLELLTRAPAVNVLDVIGCGLEVARGVVALGDVDLVLGAVVQGLVQGDGSSQELLLDLAEALQTGLELQVVVCGCLSDGGDDGNPVALGADVVCGRDAGDVNVLSKSVNANQFWGACKGLTVLPADLRLRDDQLCGVGVVGAGQGVLEHADSTQHMARDLDLVGEV